MRAVEDAYRAATQASMAQQQRFALVVWGVTLLVFALPDYVQMGPTVAFWQLTAYRIAMVVLLALVFVRLRSHPELAPGGLLVMWPALIGYPFFFLFYVLRPELRPLNTGMIMILQLILFVFLPGRAWAYVPVAAFGVVGSVLTLRAVGTPGPVLMGVLFAVTLPAVVGYASAVRLQRAQRMEFQARHQLLSANEVLKAEVQRRIALEQELQHQASTDLLTGLPNRRAFELAAQREQARARRSLQPLSLALLDIDHFKRVNDEFGHAAGDEVLRTVGQLFAQCFRGEDCVGRIGGEEFAVVLPGATLHEAGEILQRFLDKLGSTAVQVGTRSIAVTATVGLAQCGPDTPTLESLLSAADAALYTGKREGRNRVVPTPAPGEEGHDRLRRAPAAFDAAPPQGQRIAPPHSKPS